jgi:Fe-S-cluster-containing dehydrogenase component
MPKYKIIIDHELCWGCKTCEVACKQENKAPTGVKLIAVAEDGPHEIDGKLSYTFHVNLCRHCDDAPCVDACPDDAISKREDGIVVMHDDQCTGCQSCMDVCPYDAIGFDDQRGIAQKCNLCYQRVDKGLIPACADNVCLAHCIDFENTE